MTCLLALVLLVHLCHGAPVNRPLNNEMIDSLSQLNLGRANFTMEAMVPCPGDYMNKNPILCQHAFATALGNLLDSLTVDTVGQVVIQNLRGNLHILGQHEKSPPSCTTVEKKSAKVFEHYRNFLRKLNNKK